MTGRLNPVPWPPADVEGTILIAVGARYGQYVLAADGALAPPDSIAPARVSDSTQRFRIVRSGSVPILEGPIDPAA
ncbi:MAG: hypothetical protein M3Y33_00635 [Actinomycetota bacterium]|nr:hypothetical protein [Actinomycetota bacterium]